MSEAIGTGKEPPPWGKSPPPKKTSFFGRLFTLLFGGLIKKSAEKAEKLAQPVLKKDQDIAKEVTKRTTERFEANLKTILETQDFSQLKVKNGTGILSKTKKPPSDETPVLELVQQVVRQAWGRLIDAEHGFRIKEEEMQKLDQLKHHLQNYFPAGWRQGDPEKPLKILTSSYKSADLSTTSLTIEEKNKLMEAKTLKNKEIKEKVNSLRKAKLSTEPLSKEQSGVNITEFQAVEGKKVAVKKEFYDETWGSILSDMLEKPDAAATLSFASGLNEAIASNLNILLEGRLGIPLAITQVVGTTSHAVVEHQGSYADVLSHDPDLPHSMPLIPAQRFVFAELLMGNTDCHQKNILIGANNEPIPIDFGRSLPPVLSHPHSLLRAAYLNFDCIRRPINEEDQLFFSQLNIDQLMDTLEMSISSKYTSALKNPDIALSFHSSLAVLKARLIMIQEGIKSKLTQQYLIALDLPPLPNEVKTKVADQYKKNPKDESALRMIILEHTKVVGFRKAFADATEKGDFDATIFTESINKEIRRIQRKTSYELYDSDTRRAYRQANLDVS